jgi:hypothetical protein
MNVIVVSIVIMHAFSSSTTLLVVILILLGIGTIAVMLPNFNARGGVQIDPSQDAES